MVRIKHKSHDIKSRGQNDYLLAVKIIFKFLKVNTHTHNGQIPKAINWAFGQKPVVLNRVRLLIILGFQSTNIYAMGHFGLFVLFTPYYIIKLIIFWNMCLPKKYVFEIYTQWA